MNENNFEQQELVLKIKEVIPSFDYQELLEYTKIIVPNIHLLFCNDKNDKLKRYCNDKLIEKVFENKKIYRINSDIDNARVGYARLQDYYSENDNNYVKVYSSVFFYDESANNLQKTDGFDKYWNDIWVITYEGDFGNDNVNKCPTCGAPMEYNNSKHMFTCDYCRNSLYYSQINWKIVDIDVNEIEY